MKVEKLELKHVAPYLPYGLEVNFRVLDLENGNPNTDNPDDRMKDCVMLMTGAIIDESMRKEGDRWYRKDSIFKPLLRPLSDLTKEITHNGETFVPIERIKNKYMLRQKWGVSEYGFYGLQSELGDWTFIHDEDQEIHPECPVAIYTQIIEWHFDVLRLIPSNLALPKQ